MREADIERYLVRRAKEAGGEVRKVKWIGRQKAPDRVLMLPMTPMRTGWATVGCAIWVEVKKPGGLAAFPKNAHEEGQAREHERMRRAGQRVEVIDSYAGVDALFGLA